MTIFGVPWSVLELEHVEKFLASAEDEGVTWEAKGSVRPHPGQVRKAACGFANTLGGGYLIVGADRENSGRGPWRLTGVDFLGEEPTHWLAQTIRDGLRPLPVFDVTAWVREDGRHVAVVEVQPVAVPPCLTVDGQIYERVSGATVPVTDPAVLACLIERGQTAELNAERVAMTRADQLVNEADPQEPPFLSCGRGRVGANGPT